MEVCFSISSLDKCWSECLIEDKKITIPNNYVKKDSNKSAKDHEEPVYNSEVNKNSFLTFIVYKGHQQVGNVRDYIVPGSRLKSLFINGEE